TTLEFSNFTPATVQSGGNIFSVGAANATERGICWNTAPCPTTAHNRDFQNGSFGPGSYAGTVTGLVSGLTYYVRAYAINPEGTTYGETRQFIHNPEIDITGNGISIVNNSSPPIAANFTDFGSIAVDGGQVEHTFIITNSGTADLNLTGGSAVSITGVGASHFSIQSQPATPVAAGGGVTSFTIRFDPTGTGTFAAVVDIPNDDSDENPYRFDIQGMGVTPEIDITGNGVSIIDGDNTPDIADDTDFGIINLTGVIVDHIFTIINSGTDDLILTGVPYVEISGSGAAHFSVQAQPASPVPFGGGTTTFTIRFDPGALGTHVATVFIANDDTGENPYNFDIQGIGQGDPENALDFDGGDDYVDCGNNAMFNLTGNQTIEAWVYIDAMPAANWVRVVGKSEADGSNRTFGLWYHSDGSARYQVNGNALSAPGFIQIQQWYHFTGVKDGANITLYVNGQQIATGAGTAPASSGSLLIGSFYGINANHNGQIDEVRIWDVARNQTQILDNMCSPIDPALEPNLIAYYPFNHGLPGGDNTAPPVNTLYDMTANGNNGTLSGFDLNNAASNWVASTIACAPEIDLSGNGQPIVNNDNTPAVADDTNFGNTAVAGGTVDHIFTITNNGTADLSLTGSPLVEITGAGAAHFSVIAQPVTPVDLSGQTTTFTIRFDPTLSGTHTATINIDSDDGDENPYLFDISGIGDNNPPVIDLDADDSGGAGGNDFAATFTEDGGPVAIVDTDLSVTDADHTDLTSATVTITNLFDGASEILSIDTGFSGITQAYAGGILTLTGPASVLNFEQVLQTITYENTSNDPNTTARLIQFVLNDGVADGPTASCTVTIIEVNDPPQLDLDGDDSEGVPGNDFAITFNEDGGAVSIVDALDLIIVDPDHVDLNSATVTITNLQDGAAEILTATTGATGIVVNYVGGILTLTGPSSVANFETVLRTVAYENTSQNPNTTDRVVTFIVNDGADASNTATSLVTVAAFNDPPVLNPIGNQAVDEDFALNFTVGATEVDPGQTLAYSLDNSSILLGMNIDANTGVFNWTPAESQGDAAYNATITVTDNGINPANLSDSETITITVAEVNVAPVLNLIGAQNVDEQTSLNFTASATDQDNPIHTLTYSLDLASITAGMLIDTNTGAFSWTPDESQGGAAYPVTVTVTDNGVNPAGLTDQETFTITVVEENIAPVLNPITLQTVDEQALLSFTISATDQDNNPAQALIFSLDLASTTLGMAIDPNTGVFNWTPNETRGCGTYNVTVTVTDDGANPAYLTDVASFDIVVAETNVAPVLTPIGNQSIDEDQLLTFTATATDQDDPIQTLTFSLDAASIALGMTIDSGSGVFNWTPDESHSPGAYSVTVIVTDDGDNLSSLSHSEVITINVGVLNDPPQITSTASISATEDVLYVYSAEVFDPDDANDGTNISWTLTNAPAGMVISNVGAVTWTPLEGVITSGTVTISVEDGDEDGSAPDTEDFTITVTQVNDEPTAANNSVSTLEDTDYLFLAADFMFSDVDGDALFQIQITVYETVGDLYLDGDGDGIIGAGEPITAANDVIAVADIPDLKFKPQLNALGSPYDTFRFSVHDGTVYSVADYQMTINVLSQNDPPEITAGGVLNYIENQPPQTIDVGIIATDDGPNMSAATVTITTGFVDTEDVLAIPAEPAATLGITSLFNATTGILTLSSITSNPVADFEAVLQTVTYQNTSDDPTEAPRTITFTINDGSGQVSDAATINVDAVNDAPVITSSALATAIEDIPYTYAAETIDPDDPNDGTNLIWSLTGEPAGMTISPTGTITWTPLEGVTTSGPVTVEVNDGGEDGVAAATEVFTIIVTQVNDAPVITTTATATGNEAVLYTYVVGVDDPDDANDGVNLIWSLNGEPAGMIISPTGTITWTPSEGVISSGLVAVTVEDGLEDGVVAAMETFTITVVPFNNPPVITTTAPATAIEDIQFVYTTGVDDPDDSNNGVDLTWSLANAPTGMAISSTGVITWTPLEGVLTSGSVTVNVEDGGENSAQPATEIFTVTVTPVNDPPEITTAAPLSATEDVEYSYTVGISDPDDLNDGIELTWTLTGEPAGMVVSNTGTITWTPLEGVISSGLVAVTVTDGGEDGASPATETFIVTVTPVNDPPLIITTAPDVATEDILYGYEVGVSDPDDANNGIDLIWTLSDEPAGMIISNTGTISWTPLEGVLTSGTVTVSVEDGNEDISLPDTEQFTITVTPVNDAPVLINVGDQVFAEDQTLPLSVDFTDEDLIDSWMITVVPDDINISVVGLPAPPHISGQTYTLIPTNNWYGIANIAVNVTDEATRSLSDSEIYQVTVSNVNDPPVIAEIGDQVMDEDNTLQLTVNFSDPDSLDPTDTHTISVETDIANVIVRNLSGNTTGSTYILEPASNWNGTAQITITVSDNSGTPSDTDTEIYTLTVNNINDAPVLLPVGDQFTNENITKTMAVVFTDNDTWNPVDAHIITVTSDMPQVTVANLSGHISGATYDLIPDTNWAGTANITVTVTDNSGAANNLDFETYTLTVSNFNNAPVLDEVGFQTMTEDETLQLDVTFADNDPLDGHIITITTDTPAVQIQNLPPGPHTSGQTYDLAPDPDWNGIAQITVTVTDDGIDDTFNTPDDFFDTETYLLTVNNINDQPILTAVGDQIIDEDAILPLAVTFVDADIYNPTDTHLITISSDMAAVSIVGLTPGPHTSGQGYALVPDSDWNGIANITVVITDNSGSVNNSVSETYLLTVNNLNDPPVLTEIGDQNIDEDTNLQQTVEFLDPDIYNPLDTHILTITSNEPGVTVINPAGTTSGHVYQLAPGPSWYGTAQITVSVQDNCTSPNAAATETYTLTVGNLNDPPVITIVGTLDFTEGDPATPIDNTLTILDLDNPDLVQAVVEINTGLVSSEDSLICPTLPPEISLNPASTRSRLIFDGLATIDSYQDLLRQVAYLNSNQANPNPMPRQAAFSVNDGENETTANITINIINVNDAPQIVPIGNYTVDEETSLFLTVLATDPEGDNLSYSLDANSVNRGMSLHPIAGEFNWPPAEAQGGDSYTVTVTVTDNGINPANQTDAATFTIQVVEVNTPPILSGVLSHEVTDGQLLSFTVDAADHDIPAQNLSFNLDPASISLGMSIETNSGQFNWTPDEIHSPGAYLVTVKVTDDGTNPVALADSIQFSITVTETNDPPTVSAIPDQTIDEGAIFTPIILDDFVSDPDHADYTLIWSHTGETYLQVSLSNRIAAVNPPNTDWFGQETIIFIATDPGGLDDSVSVSFTVIPVDDPPMVANGLPDFMVNEDASDEIIDLSNVFTDIDSDDNSIVTSVFGISNPNLLDAEVIFNQLRLTFAADSFGVASVFIQATTAGGSVYDTLTITVQPVNDAPMISEEADQTMDEDTSLSLTVDFVEIDPWDTHVISVITSDPLHVNIQNCCGSISGSGYDLVPVSDWFGTVAVTVTVTDDSEAENNSDIDNYSLTILPINDPPLLTEVGDQTIMENSMITMTVEFSDVDVSDSHIINIESSDPAHVQISDLSGNISGSAYNLIPAADWIGTAEITVTVTDNNDGVDTETYTVIVANVNDAPSLVNVGNQFTNEGTSKNMPVTFSDPDPGDSHFINITSSDPAHVSVANLNGHTSGSTYDLVPTAAWNGTVQITVTITDNGLPNLSDSETYNLTVSNANNAPEIVDVAVSQNMDEDTALNMTVDFTDLDGDDTHTITITSDNSAVSIANLSGHISGSTYDLVPAPDWNGSALITVQVTDDFGFYDINNFVLMVQNINDPPILVLTGNHTITEDSTLAMTVDFSDADIYNPVDFHAITIVSSDPNVAVSNLSGNPMGSLYELEPAANWHGTTDMTVTVTDNSGAVNNSATEIYTLTVVSINDAPIVSRVGDQVMDEDTILGMTLDFSDEDVDDLHTITIASSNPEHVSISTNREQTFLYGLTPVTDWFGTVQVTVTVTDNSSAENDSDQEIYTLTVENVNDQPELVEVGDQTIPEDSLLNLPVNFADNDPTDTHTISIVSSDPTNVTIQNLSGHISGSTYLIIPVANWFGTASITVTVTDNSETGNDTDSETFTFITQNINDPPLIFYFGYQCTQEKTPKLMTVDSADDAPDDDHTIIISSDNPNVTVQNLSGNPIGSIYELHPAANWSGVAEITVIVTDDGDPNLSDSEIYSLIVSNDGDPPIITKVGFFQQMNEDEVKTMTVIFTDGDTGDNHTITILSDTVAVAIENLSGHTSGSTYDLVPMANWNGTALISVRVTDSANLYSTDNYVLTVNNTNDAPVITEV
ncbi:MAG: tandem-95 repeat protein, partial [Planctomycetes bacterium]|nr:tandem-95 repeat protein [Planctomycetota bacterium]